MKNYYCFQANNINHYDIIILMYDGRKFEWKLKMVVFQAQRCVKFLS